VKKKHELAIDGLPYQKMNIFILWPKYNNFKVITLFNQNWKADSIETKFKRCGNYCLTPYVFKNSIYFFFLGNRNQTMRFQFSATGHLIPDTAKHGDRHMVDVIIVFRLILQRLCFYKNVQVYDNIIFRLR